MENPTPNTQPEMVGFYEETTEATKDLENLQVWNRSLCTDEEQDGLTDQQKSLMSNLYKIGLKLAKSESHKNFLSKCLKSNLVPKGLSFQKQKYNKDVGDILARAEIVRIENEVTRLEKLEKEQRIELGNIKENIYEVFTNKEVLLNKYEVSEKRWRKSLKLLDWKSCKKNRG